MHLHALEVENFRGVRRARLTFEETTVLIGENDCGKSSLLEALALVLGAPGGEAPPFQADHFHRDEAGAAVGPLRIGLDFRERAPGEWGERAGAELPSLVADAPGRTRRLELRMEAIDRGGEEVVTSWTIDSSGTKRRRSVDDESHLAAVRRLSPILWLKGGALAGFDPAAVEVSFGRETLVDQLEASYKDVIEGRDADRRLESGYRTALRIIERSQFGGSTQNEAFRPIISEIFGRRATGTRSVTERTSEGSAARKLATLMLTAALLRSAPVDGVGGSMPLLVVEDPEAHLHPMTLASVWTLLSRIPAQKIVTTHSATLLLGAPLRDVRRLTRRDGIVREWSVPESLLGREELRKVSYHLRMKRSPAMFARCWLMVEGETEFWMLPELARLCGYDFQLEGIACIEFAQCGLPPLIKVAKALGIEWHVLSDGDEAGEAYAATAARLATRKELRQRVTLLAENDVEHSFWRHGFSSVFMRAAGRAADLYGRSRPTAVIRKALGRRSKPAVAFDLILAAAEEGGPGVPPPLRSLIETCVRLARDGAPPTVTGKAGTRRRR